MRTEKHLYMARELQHNLFKDLLSHQINAIKKFMCHQKTDLELKKISGSRKNMLD